MKRYAVFYLPGPGNRSIGADWTILECVESVEYGLKALAEWRANDLKNQFGLFGYHRYKPTRYLNPIRRFKRQIA